MVRVQGLSYSKMFNRVKLEIDLGAIKANLRAFQKAVYPAKLMVVIKAHGYGIFSFPTYKKHFEPILEVYQELNIKCFAVSNAIEAIYFKKLLKQKKYTGKIFLLGDVFPKEIGDLVKNQITITLADLDKYLLIEKIARQLKISAEVLLLLDTGMGRLGISAHHAKQQLTELLNRYQSRFVKIKGMFSHLSNAHLQDDKHTLRQIDVFDELKEWILNSYPALTKGWEFHLANSWGAGNYPASHHDLVRIGIGQYGVEPQVMKNVKVKSAVSLKSFLISKRKLPVGHSISYDCRYHLPKSTWVGTVSAGYADGIPLGMSSKIQKKKHSSNSKSLINGWVLIKGKKYPVIGKITMDYMMVDLGPAPTVKVGDEVVFFGKSGKQEITVAQFADYKNTHGYEVLCAISSLRVERKYLHKKPQARFS